jgi:hypothetical protein
MCMMYIINMPSVLVFTSQDLQRFQKKLLFFFCNETVALIDKTLLTSHCYTGDIKENQCASLLTNFVRAAVQCSNSSTEALNVAPVR